MNLTINNIKAGYEGKEVIRDCSYAFKEGGVYILTGDNGCGKSTLLTICSLLRKPDSGTVEYYEDRNLLVKDINLRRRITIVLPRAGLFNSLVYNNVIYGLKLRKIPRKLIEDKALEALDFVGLSHKIKQNALTLSSGEAQRLAIARAVITDPDILFLDEPTASVDKKNISIIEDIIFRLKDNRRIIIMATHNEQQARRLGDKVLLMEEGILHQEESITHV